MTEDTDNLTISESTAQEAVNHPQRPNAKYRLSKPDIDPYAEEQLTFYYNRERRLAKAPQVVKDLYAERKTGFNLLRPLIADKPRATLFFTIVLLCVMIIMIGLLGFFERSYTLDGNKLIIRGTGYEGTAIVVLKKTSNSNSAYSGAVDIAVSPVVKEGDDFPVFYHRIFFSLETEEEYRFVVPFDSPQLAIFFQTEKSSLNMKLNID